MKTMKTVRQGIEETVIEEWFDEAGRRSRLDGPAIRFYRVGPDGQEYTIRELWMWDGLPHRDGAPANVYYDEKGLPWRQEWYSFGKLHRPDGPAVVEHTEAGLRLEWWYAGKQIPGLRSE
jgi:hypothetical protein